MCLLESRIALAGRAFARPAGSIRASKCPYVKPAVEQMRAWATICRLPVVCDFEPLGGVLFLFCSIVGCMIIRAGTIKTSFCEECETGGRIARDWMQENTGYEKTYDTGEQGQPDLVQGGLRRTGADRGSRDKTERRDALDQVGALVDETRN
jgi:hypothetical protein